MNILSNLVDVKTTSCCFSRSIG